MLSEKKISGLLKELSRLKKNPNFLNSQRFRDFLVLLRSDQVYYDLHRDFYQIIERSREWSSYDYNQGYFYQSFPSGKIMGLRDTNIRIKEYSLFKDLHNKNILNIGCNLGFLDCELSSSVSHIDAFDINPYLIEIAKKAKDFMKISNVNFYNCSFEEYESDLSYEVVLSFANHSTYDGRTDYTIREYFQKVCKLLKDGGMLFLESHAPAYEKNFQDVLNVVESMFYIEKKIILNKGTPIDVGRTFIRAKKK